MNIAGDLYYTDWWELLNWRLRSSMREAKIEKWSIVFSPEIYKSVDTPERVYATFQKDRDIALFGIAKDDPRYNPETGEFKDGHRLVSDAIVKVEDGRVYTDDTIWSPGEINSEYLAWCKQHGYIDFELADCILREKEYIYHSGDKRHNKSIEYAETVIIPADITSIDHNFYGWGKVEKFHVEVGNLHFADIDGVLFDNTKNVLIKYPEGRACTDYKIPAGVTEIKTNAFSDYRDIFARFAHRGDMETEKFCVEIPSSVKIIGNMAFNSGSRRLSGVIVFENNPYFESIGGVLYDKNIETLICCPSGAGARSSNTTHNLPDSVKVIMREGFNGCAYLSRVILPAGLMQIGEHAFEECTNLLEINIPGTVKSISPFSFSYCFKLTNVILNEGTERIGSAAFAMCNFMKNIIIPRSVKEIDPHAIGKPPSLTIHCYEDSFAHSFAKEQGIPFALIGDTLPEFRIECDTTPGLLRIEDESLEEKLMGNSEIAELLEKISDIAGPIIVKGADKK